MLDLLQDEKPRERVVAGTHSTARAATRHLLRLEAELDRRALSWFYAAQFSKWCAHCALAHVRLAVWKRWAEHHVRIHRKQKEARRVWLARRVVATRRFYNMACELRSLNPIFYRLKYPAVPHEASMGAVVVLFVTPIFIALVAFLASWTSIAVLLMWMMPSGAIFAGLVTPLSEPPARVTSAKRGETCVHSMGQALMGVSGKVKEWFTRALALLVSLTNVCCCGKFQEVFAYFVQGCMGLSAGLQIRDALIVLPVKPFAALIGFIIAAVQLPDFVGWLCGEVWKVHCMMALIDKVNELIDIICRSVESRAEKVVQDVTAIANSLHSQYCAGSHAYQQLAEPPQHAKGSEHQAGQKKDEEAAATQLAANEEPADGRKKLYATLNGVGLQFRQSPFKMLTAMIDLIMMLDEIEATRQGSSPWLVAASSFPPHGMLATLPSFHIREVCAQEYNEGLANEAARTARKTMRIKAEQRLRAALAPPLLDIDANEVFEAATEGEEAELAANMIQQARARAQEAIDAQRLAREEEERRKARRIVAARDEGVRSNRPVDCEKLQGAIDEAEEAGVGFADVQLAIEKCSLAKAQQEKRAHAEAFLDEAMTPEPIAAGLPHSALLRINIDRLAEALEAGMAGSARPALMLRAQKVRQQAGKAQRELSTMLVLAMGKFRKLAKDVKARELARRRLLEAVRVAMAQLELTFPPLDVDTCDAERVEQACAVAEGQSGHAGACQAHLLEEAQHAYDTGLADSMREVHAAMAYAESLGLDTSSSSSAVQRIHQVTTKKMSALAKASPAMTACDEAIERVAQQPHDQLLAASYW
ncbi:MAG: hypothetical protein SGPRY_008106 [Prymnesium sp.]